MTNSDDLLKRLEGIADTLDITGLRASGEAVEQAAARIRKMEAELAFYKGFHDGVCKDGTHVIVPVEPTESMLLKGREKGGDGFYHLENAYRAMIRAAQEGDNG